MKRRYKLEDASLENQVFLSFNDNWVEISLRYIVDYRERRNIKDKIFSEILLRFEQEGDRLEIASETLEVIARKDKEKNIEMIAFINLGPYFKGSFF